MLNVLSRQEVERLHTASKGELAGLLRRCVLAVLNSDHLGDDVEQLLSSNAGFEIDVEQVNRGLRLQISNAPAGAFVDGEIIEGIRALLSAVIRDLVYYDSEIRDNPHHNLESSSGITNVVFEMLRNARAMPPQVTPDLVVCWGGHSITSHEYEYTKNCGYQLGLRRLNIITGCGPGAMKGAAIGHVKQHIEARRYIGISEPGIIAAESPNPIVNELIVMPDIEKRLEAFVRLGHGIIIFPGGVDTAEEILYLLGILLNPANRDIPFPMIMTGPAESTSYFAQMDDFIVATLGEEARAKYRIVIDDPVEVARHMQDGLDDVRKFRIRRNDAFYFNWLLEIDRTFQSPFKPTHENMAETEIDPALPPHLLAANLRRIFSGIVAGNVKPEGLAAIRQYGLFQIKSDKDIMKKLGLLLQGFIADGRMKLPGGSAYMPCYQAAV